MIVMIRIVQKLCPDKDDVMQWQKQAGNIATNIKVDVDFTLPSISATNGVAWKCHVDDSAKGGYDMILVRYLSI